MVIYPVPAAVTQARVQLVADQTEKAPQHVIAEDVMNVFAAKNEAVRRNVAVDDEVLDSPRSVVIQEAYNRMVVQMAVLYRMLRG